MPPFAPARAWSLALIVASAACNDPPPPKPTKVSELPKPSTRPTTPSPFRNPDTDAPPPRSEPQLPPEELAATLAAADEALKIGDSSAAITILHGCANKVPQSVRCEGELAMLLGKLKRYTADARYYLDQAIAADDPGLDDAYYRRFGAALMARGLAKEATVAYERMIARSKPTAADWYLLSEALQGVPERLTDAADAARKAYEMDPSQHEWLRTEAILLSQIPDKIAQAIARFEEYRAKIKDPDLQQDTDRRLAELRTIEPAPAPAKATATTKPAVKQRKQKPASG
jgi:tetratricopeptide (TPR) repeat protein